MIEELQDELIELETLTEEEASMKFNCDSKKEYKELLLDEIEALKSKESRDLSGERYGYDYY